MIIDNPLRLLCRSYSWCVFYVFYSHALLDAAANKLLLDAEVETAY